MTFSKTYYIQWMTYIVLQKQDGNIFHKNKIFTRKSKVFLEIIITSQTSRNDKVVLQFPSTKEMLGETLPKSMRRDEKTSKKIRLIQKLDPFR